MDRNDVPLAAMDAIIEAGGRACRLVGDPAARCVLLQAVDPDGRELDDQLAALRRATQIPFLMAAFPVADWDDELTPWPAPPAFGDRPFGGHAEATLRWLEDALLPALKDRLRADGGGERLLIPGGYSLAGLFALWAVTRSGRYSAVAAASPSVWYPDWLDYVGRNPIRAGSVYLSLGEREGRARAPIRQLYDSLCGRGLRCALEWNPGNHFRDPAGRTARAFAWALEAAL